MGVHCNVSFRANLRVGNIVDNEIPGSCLCVFIYNIVCKQKNGVPVGGTGWVAMILNIIMEYAFYLSVTTMLTQFNLNVKILHYVSAVETFLSS